MELPRAIIPRPTFNKTALNQNIIDAVENFNQIVNLKDNYETTIISYSIDCQFYSTDFPEIEKEINSPLIPNIYEIKLYFHTIDQKFDPIPVVYNSNNPITTVDLLNFISKIYQTPLTDQNVEFYHLYDSDYSYLTNTNTLGDVMKYCYFKDLKIYHDGFLVNIFD